MYGPASTRPKSATTIPDRAPPVGGVPGASGWSARMQPPSLPLEKPEAGGGVRATGGRIRATGARSRQLEMGSGWLEIGSNRTVRPGCGIFNTGSNIRSGATLRLAELPQSPGGRP
ncbi:hypothetical protein GCM10010275_35750 [Streptomyces litmocidini]|nr:hypothetical protein GCM10010275_35750 [Streptomyces litmocidini]